MGSSTGEVTRILAELNQGDGPATERLLPLVYDELRALAGSYFARRQAGHTLQPTALVHEAYLKLAGGEGRWQNRAHFMAVAAKAMRQILMNHARDKAAMKRGGGAAKITIIEAVTPASDGSDAERQLDLIALGLYRLPGQESRKKPRRGRAGCWFFGQSGARQSEGHSGEPADFGQQDLDLLHRVSKLIPRALEIP